MSRGTDHYFVSVEVKEHITLMPSYIGRIKQGIFEHLNRRILQYSPELNGVLICYSNLVILQNSGLIADDYPQVHFDLKYSACIFQPPVGCVLNATVNRIGDGYISCLSQSCFSIYISVDSNDKYDVSIGDEVNVRIVEPSFYENDLVLIGELVIEEVKKKKHKDKEISSIDTAVIKLKKHKYSKKDNTSRTSKRSLMEAEEELNDSPLSKKLKLDNSETSDCMNGVVRNKERRKGRKRKE